MLTNNLVMIPIDSLRFNSLDLTGQLAYCLFVSNNTKILFIE